MSASRTQDDNLRRVTERVSAAVLEFCFPGRQFHMAELNDYCAERVGNLAPDSPGRILRLLRQAKRIQYHVVSRRDSIYRVEPEPPTPRPISVSVPGLFGDISPDRSYRE
jgi:hypothetical protein